MLIRALLLIAGIAWAPGVALAGDSRIRSTLYQPGTVVTIAGCANIQSTIAFAPDERIENIAIGDSAAWQVTPNKRANLIFLKPQSPRGRTNMTVITDQRTYMFDLVARPNGAPALYALQFTYPPAPPAPPADPVKPVVTAVAAFRPAATLPDFHWTKKGPRRLLPSRVFDDGNAVYLSWDADVPMPAMLSVSPDGTEGPVNYSVKGDFVVVDGVPARLVLRAGKASAELDHQEAPHSGAIAAITPAAER